jgi:hypothetical protein
MSLFVGARGAQPQRVRPRYGADLAPLYGDPRGDARRGTVMFNYR